MSDYAEAQAALETRLAEMGVTLVATFVPFSKSRNAKEPRASINWRVTICRRSDRPTLTTDYSMGVGYLPPAYRNVKRCGSPRSIMADGIEREACEKGKACGFPDVIPPRITEVLAALLSDGEAYSQTFDEWAGNYGYDPDSRTAEKTFNACREIGAKVARLFSAQEIEELHGMMDAAGL